jgi:hypothetical protein
MTNHRELYRLPNAQSVGRIIIIGLSLFFVLLASSCGIAAIGWGVVLWPEKDAGVDPGTVVPITSEQKTKDTLIFYDEKSKKSVLTPAWRIERFESKGKAVAFQKKYAEFANLYAYGERDGVPPVREEPLNSTGVKIITKPKAGQILKIVSRSEQKVPIDEMSDYWYEVLVEYQGINKNGEFAAMGGRGYCFGYFLKIFESQSNSEKDIAKKVADLNTDKTLEHILNNTWRPIYFQEMIERGKINTNLFNNNIGIFPLPLSSAVEIVTPKGKFNFPYSEVIKVKTDSYSFKDTNLRIEALSERKISATFIEDNKQVTALYVLIDEDIDSLYDKEIDSREAAFKSFYDKGTVLSSSAYGSITLDEKRRMTWKNFSKLVPAIIPDSVAGNGWVDFPYTLSSELKKTYDGIVTIFFTELKAQKTFSFVYKFADNGVRLYFVPESNINDSRVERLGANPIVIYFSF